MHTHKEWIGTQLIAHAGCEFYCTTNISNIRPIAGIGSKYVMECLVIRSTLEKEKQDTNYHCLHNCTHFKQKSNHKH